MLPLPGCFSLFCRSNPYPTPEGFQHICLLCVGHSFASMAGVLSGASLFPRNGKAATTGVCALAPFRRMRHSSNALGREFVIVLFVVCTFHVCRMNCAAMFVVRLL